MDPTAIEAHLKLVFLQWMVIIGVAWVFGRLAWRVGQPPAVGEILAGILLGPSFFGFLWPSDWPLLFPPETQQSLQVLAKVGLILLLFQVGMEFDFGHLRSRSRTVSSVAVLGLVAPGVAGILIGPWLHRNFAPEAPFFGFQLFLCIALAISALPIMGRILLELGLERTPLAVVAVSAAAIDDVTGWVLLAVATALVTADFVPSALILQVTGILLFVCVVLMGVGPLLRALWRRMTLRHGEEFLPPSFLAILLMALLGCAYTTNVLGIFSIFGAFALGVSLHQESGLVRAWRRSFYNFVLVALVPIFFTNTGLNTEIGSLQTGTAWLGFTLVMLAAVGGKLGGCWLGARATGQSSRAAGCIGALMNARALMGLVAINIGLDLGLLPPELFTMLVLMALLTTAMTGPLLRRWLPDDVRAQATPSALSGKTAA